jgi:ABC-type transport system involved in cytochrome bd biosynthesis fused ATPase/permease subunit
MATGGQPLTMGQSLRLMLARALALKPRVLILDELLDLFEDTPERDKLIEDLADASNEWTLIVASRSRNVVSKLDRVLELRDGKVIDPKEMD